MVLLNVVEEEEEEGDASFVAKDDASFAAAAAAVDNDTPLHHHHWDALDTAEDGVDVDVDTLDIAAVAAKDDAVVHDTDAVDAACVLDIADTEHEHEGGDIAAAAAATVDVEGAKAYHIPPHVVRDSLNP